MIANVSLHHLFKDTFFLQLHVDGFFDTTLKTAIFSGQFVNLAVLKLCPVSSKCRCAVGVLS